MMTPSRSSTASWGRSADGRHSRDLPRVRPRIPAPRRRRHAAGAQEGDRRHPFMPHRGERQRRLPLRGVRPEPHPEPLLRQPALPPVPEPQDYAVAGAADGAHASGAPLHAYLHSARGVARLHPFPPEALLRCALRRLLGGDEEALPRPQARGGGDLPGFFGVLHTWGRQRQYHPHIHYVVPGGAISTADGSWRRSGEHFFLPVKALLLITGSDLSGSSNTAPLRNLPVELRQILWLLSVRLKDFSRHYGFVIHPSLIVGW